LVSVSASQALLKDAIVTAATILMYTFLPLMSLGMVQRRLELVERGFGQSLGAGIVAKTRLGVLLVLLALDGYAGYSISIDVAVKPWAFRVFYSLLGFTSLVVAVIVIVGLARVCAAAEPSRLCAGSYAQAEAIWSRALLRQLCVALVLPCFFASALYFAEAFNSHWGEVQWSFRILSVSDQTLSAPLESMCLFTICGFFQPEHPELFPKKQKGMGNRSTSQILDADASSPGGQQSSASSWDKTVQSLSGRSLKVEELLEFFCRLGPRRDASGAEAVMPSYDPWLSTTSDVVRGAIIPLSRAGDSGLAYTNCLPGAAASISTTLPDCMVSHTWSALFLDLVAAVVADALELDEYGKVAQRLAEPRGAQKLLQEVRRKSCQRYWICAFCVNQHVGICNGFGSEPTPGSDQHSRWDAGRRDTVTGGVFGLCSCSEPKYFDGPMCEMNKFDDMMGLLQHRQPNLRHLVAVDRRFELFSRAWCVAELVQSYLSNLPQTVLLLSNRALDVQAECLETYNFLATLTVLECKASREEDHSLPYPVPDPWPYCTSSTCMLLVIAVLPICVHGDCSPVTSPSFVGKEHQPSPCQREGAANSAAHARAAQAMAALACFCLLPGCSACAASKDAAPSSRCSCLMADCADCAVPARGQKRKRSDFAQSGKLLAAAAVLACMCLLPTCQPCAEGNGVLPVPRALRLRLPGAFPDEPLLSLEQPDCSIMWLLAASSPGFDRVDAAARAARRAASAAAASEGP
ncbi:unnamed protein product, partial [Polarella glacialis]